ncbi:MAG: hypothetical protein ACLRMZ_10300 [Blautia marasmi]
MLFLNLEPYSGFEQLFSCGFERNLGDLFYYIRQKKGQPAVQLAAMVHEAGGLSYVPPVITPEDVEQITGEEWSALLRNSGFTVGIRWSFWISVGGLPRRLYCLMHAARFICLSARTGFQRQSWHSMRPGLEVRGGKMC